MLEDELNTLRQELEEEEREVQRLRQVLKQSYIDEITSANK